MKRIPCAPLVALVLAALVAPAGRAATIFSNGFESSTAGWSGVGSSSIERRATGSTGETYAEGVAAASGGFLARLRTGVCQPSQITCSGPRTTWGGTAPFANGGAATEIAIYLDTAWAAGSPDVRFDWSSALSDDAGNHLQDYVFNVGTDPAGLARFVISASTNATRAGSNPSSPSNGPFLVSAAGWYLFRHTFRNDGGNVAVDLTLRDTAGNVLSSWTIPAMRDGAPVARTSVGGLRYGWFANQEIPGLAIDASTARDFTPSITGPSERSTRGAVELYGTGAHDVPIAIREGATTVATASPGLAGDWSAVFSLPEGTHTLRAVSTLAGWDSLPSPAVVVNVDLTAPAAPTISQPASGSTNPVRLTIAGSSEPGTRIDLRVLERVVGSATTDGGGQWSVVLELADGTHSVTAQATDDAGYASPGSVSRSFVVDAFAPRAEISAPANNTIVGPGVPIEVVGKARDDRGVASIRVDVHDALGTRVRTGFALCRGCPAGDTEWTYAISGLGPGLYTARAYATDLAGNPSLGASTSFVKTV